MKYINRFVWYIATRLMVCCFVLSVLVFAFYYAMNASNIYIILKDGMAKRAQVIMLDADEEQLESYFSTNYLERDEALTAHRDGTDVYSRYYSITGFDHRVKLTWVWCWPWEDTAKAYFEERIPAIDGKLNSAGKEEAQALGLTSSPPKWQSARYQVVLSRENGQWRIKNLTLVQTLTDE